MSVESHWLQVQAIRAALQAGKGRGQRAKGKRPRLPTESAALLGTPLESQPSDVSLNFGVRILTHGYSLSKREWQK